MMPSFACRRVGVEYFESAPHRQIVEERIAATPDQIFEVFADADSWPQYIGPISRVEWTSPSPFRNGTTRRVWLKGGMVIDEEFLVWEHGVRMAFIITRANMPAFDVFAEDYRITDHGDGSCTLRWCFCLEPLWILRPLFVPIRPLMEWSNRQSAGKLRRYVESRYPRP